MKIRRTLCVAGMGLLGILTARGHAATAADAGPTAVPATQPTAVAADPAVAKLIDQLADPSPAVRERASKSLQEMGKPILPQLELLDLDDGDLEDADATLLLERLAAFRHLRAFRLGKQHVTYGMFKRLREQSIDVLEPKAYRS